MAASVDQNAAKDALIALHKEYEAVKDQMIADLKADNDFLRKQVHPSKSALRKVLEHIEKILIFAAGAYVGGL